MADNPAPCVDFSGFGLSTSMLSALARAEYSQPTPVQAGVIPKALEGADLLGQARTGTGKTAAFAIPILEQVTAGRRGGATSTDSRTN